MSRFPSQVSGFDEPKEGHAKVHQVLSPKLWYGMPAYAKDGKVVCFFQSAQKFNMRYATFGFSDAANLDEGAVWPVAFALKELTAAQEARISTLVKKAVSSGLISLLVHSRWVKELI